MTFFFLFFFFSFFNTVGAMLMHAFVPAWQGLNTLYLNGPLARQWVRFFLLFFV